VSHLRRSGFSLRFFLGLPAWANLCRAYGAGSRRLLHPDDCAQHLARGIDRDDFSMFSFSGYRGVKSFLGSVTGRKFKVFQRGYKNIPLVLSGDLLPHGEATQVEGRFDLEPTSKIAICLFSVVGIVIAAPIVLYSLREHTVPRWLALSFAVVYFVGAVVAPRIFTGIRLDQERAITDFLCVTLEAGEDPTAFPVANSKNMF
jgi:hypothetical protein